ncbi:ATP-binding cassette domain-containing protein [Corynebacterium sp. sy039]|uniref:ATP-binding cassette domain-containing protein n=1 Tax=Corynebacterium sp. sy039 TaxID=2599641 RepID=UPI0011B81D1E|nr:ATP-binding cassette domain-containing protein [Corynebacterium sp. sy039]QDZ42351.1 ATP-binding cassette domain-containing protein [Corynebacterium sp. sy039]
MIDYSAGTRSVIIGDSGSGLSRFAQETYEADPENVAIASQKADNNITFLRDTVIEEVVFGLEQRGIASDDMHRRARHILTQLGLWQLSEANPAQLSGGQTKRLSIAEVAILEHKVLFLDSPFAGLDQQSIQAVIDFIAGYPGAVILLLTEDHELLDDSFHRFYLYDDSLTTQKPEEKPFEIPERVASSDGIRREIPIGTVQAVRGVKKRKFWQFRAPQQRVFRSEEISLPLFQGEITWLRGANGAGKTSLMRAMVGFDGAEGLDVSVTMQTQQATDQVFSTTMSQFVGNDELLAQWGIDPEMHPYDVPQAHLRLGQVAAVLGRKTQVVLLDEPDVGLDRHSRQYFHHLLAAALRQGQAMVLTCHDARVISEMRQYCTVNEVFLPSPVA